MRAGVATENPAQARDRSAGCDERGQSSPQTAIPGPGLARLRNLWLRITRPHPSPHQRQAPTLAQDVSPLVAVGLDDLRGDRCRAGLWGTLGGASRLSPW